MECLISNPWLSSPPLMQSECLGVVCFRSFPHWTLHSPAHQVANLFTKKLPLSHSCPTFPHTPTLISHPTSRLVSSAHIPTGLVNKTQTIAIILLQGVTCCFYENEISAQSLFLILLTVPQLSVSYSKWPSLLNCIVHWCSIVLKPWIFPLNSR